MCVLRLCQRLKDEMSLAVITNDIYTREDAEFLLRENVLPADRVCGVETGGCPHTAIRDDTSMNMAAVSDLENRHPDLKLILIESGGDNLSATFSPELVDAYIYVIDVAEGDKIPRKGGPAIRTSDLLLINKTELAPTSAPISKSWPAIRKSSVENAPSSSPTSNPKKASPKSSPG